MRLVTRHFAFISGRQWWNGRAWWRRQVRVALMGRAVDKTTAVPGEPPYRFTASLEWQLFPDLTWYQHDLGVWWGRRRFFARPYAMRGWPLRVSARDWVKRPSTVADVGVR
jgi:hypothetical protein